MSRSSNVDMVNPAAKFFKWSASAGKFEYYNKDSKTNIQLELPFKFIVLDTLSTIKGYSDVNQSGFWSNEVRDLQKETLSVYTKIAKKDTKKVITGLYNDIKGDKNIVGSKYCQSVYIAITLDEKLTLCNIQLTGAALSAWIDFNKNNDIYKGAVEVASFTEGKKGNTLYKIPVFKSVNIEDALNEEAKNLDKTLQEYLAVYFKKEEVTEN